MLCHPGAKCTERSLRQHLVWPGLTKDVEAYVSPCHQCQKYKSHRAKYGYVQPKLDDDAHPWHTICVDEIGPYSVDTKVQGITKTLTLNAMTICDPVTGWFEIVEIPDKTAETAGKKLDQVWLCRYPRPVRCIYDNGSEFLGKDFQEMLESMGIEAVPTTVKNPQANFVERIHQTLGNMLHTQELDDNYPFDLNDPWTDIISKCAWTLRASVHSLMEASPGQLIFGRDMLFDVSFIANWQILKDRRREAALDNAMRENKSRVYHEYKSGDQVLLSRDKLQRKMNAKRDGPYQVVTVYDNGVVKIRKGIVTEKISIRRLSPYKS